MTWTDGNYDEPSVSGPWTLRVKDIFWPPPEPKPSGDADGSQIIPSEDRKTVMRSLDPQEVKLTFWAFALAIVAGIAIPAYILATDKITKAGKHSISVAPDALWLGAVILACSIGGLIFLWKRKRTLVAFLLFLVGFGFTLFIGLIGFVFILVGGWLMLRAWRINRYGTTNAKLIRQEAARRPRGKAAASSPRASSKGKASSQPGVRKPPTASKRYTPKAPPRKKIPKPTQ
jgi:hypothetical protein